MPYHSDALQASWTELDEKLQTLILALMRVVGGGLLTTGILIVVLLAIPYRAGETWAAYTIPALALITCLSSLYATSSVKIKTSASPPVELSLAAVVLISLGFFFSRL